MFRRRCSHIAVFVLVFVVVVMFCKIVQVIHSRRTSLLCVRGDPTYGVTRPPNVEPTDSANVPDPSQSPIIRDEREFPAGIHPTIYYDKDYRFPPDKVSNRLGEDKYHNYFATYQVECRHRTRVGDIVDGGWDVCLAGPYRPTTNCLVYSFGIGDNWSFDDKMAKEFGCQVKSFDPSIGLEEHERSSKIHFYPYGLGSEEGEVKKSYQLRTFPNILQQLGDSNRTLDYVKMDIDRSEWPVLEYLLKEGTILGRIKQLALEFHVRRSSTIGDLAEYVDILTELESHGFRRWYVHGNSMRFYVSMLTDKYRTSCYEAVYINIQYLQPAHNQMWTILNL